MSKLRNFPEKIYLGMDKSGEISRIPEKEPLAFITRMGICKTEIYTIGDRAIADRPKRIRKAPKLTQTFAITLPEPDSAGRRRLTANQPAGQPKALSTATEAESKHKKWCCNKCGLEFDKPFITSDGVSCCPECMSGNIKETESKKDKNWICDNKDCGAEFDEPETIDGAPYCPTCGSGDIILIHPYSKPKRQRRRK